VIILDTNVLSELMRASPSSAVGQWIGAHPASSLFITTITQGEILYGVAILPRGRRRSALRDAVNAMFEEDFADRVLPFDTASAHAFAQVASTRRRAGRPISQLDAQIAAIALSRNAAIATRNVSDFEDCGVPVQDPWQHRP
jgi:toxin FitB